MASISVQDASENGSKRKLKHRGLEEPSNDNRWTNRERRKNRTYEVEGQKEKIDQSEEDGSIEQK